MIDIKSPRELTQLRRLALASQGLFSTSFFGRGLSGAYEAIKHLGYVQIDTISVVERAHHHVLFSRVPVFSAEMTNQLLVKGEVFEYWAHAAAFLPMDDFRFSLPYKHAIKSGQTHWYKNPDRKLMEELLARVRSDGPLRSRDLESNTKKRAGWWDWKPAKKALEQLYMQGDLMISDREGFQKTYDLTERVLPTGVRTSVPSMAEFADHLLAKNLRCHGVVSMKGLTHQRRNTGLRQAVKVLVEERISAGLLEEVQLISGERFLIEAGALERSLPRLNNRLCILSPFDNSVILRDRLKALFQFDYQLECYVPEAKRRYGYFSLPLLYRDQFIGRMDCKAHRKSRHLEIKSLFIEQRKFDEEQIINTFVKAIDTFKRFQNCDSVSLVNVYPQKLTKGFRCQLKKLD